MQHSCRHCPSDSPPHHRTYNIPVSEVSLYGASPMGISSAESPCVVTALSEVLFFLPFLTSQPRLVTAAAAVPPVAHPPPLVPTSLRRGPSRQRWRHRWWQPGQPNACPRWPRRPAPPLANTIFHQNTVVPAGCGNPPPPLLTVAVRVVVTVMERWSVKSAPPAHAPRRGRGRGVVPRTTAPLSGAAEGAPPSADCERPGRGGGWAWRGPPRRGSRPPSLSPG